LKRINLNYCNSCAKNKGGKFDNCEKDSDFHCNCCDKCRASCTSGYESGDRIFRYHVELIDKNIVEAIQKKSLYTQPFKDMRCHNYFEKVFYCKNKSQELSIMENLKTSNNKFTVSHCTSSRYNEREFLEITGILRIIAVIKKRPMSMETSRSLDSYYKGWN